MGLFRGRGVPNTRPSSAARLEAIAAGMEYDADAKRSQQAARKYRGSPQEATDRSRGRRGGPRINPR